MGQCDEAGAAPQLCISSHGCDAETPPAGPLHVIITCLEYEPAYNDDRIAQVETVAGLATDPDLDGSLPIIVAGDLNAAPNSPILRPLSDVLSDAWSAGGGDPAAVTLPSSHPLHLSRRGN